MHKLIGATLVVVGLVLIYLFTATGMLAGADIIKGGKAGITLPFKVVGSRYPTDVLLLLFGIAATVIGMVIMFRRMGGKQTDTPRISRALLLNAILMVIFILTAYIGAKEDPAKNARAIGVFTMVVLMQIAVGAMLMIGTFSNRRRLNPSTIAGSGIYILGTLLTALSLIFGGAK